MSVLDRDLQNAILRILEQAYPASVSVDVFTEHAPPEIVNANVCYLSEHGLIDCIDGTTLGSACRLLIEPKITARGLDFLADDGGLTAILGRVTVRLHEDTIKETIAAWVAAQGLSAADSSRYISRLRALPADATKHLLLRFLDLGLESAPKALQLIQTLLG